MNQIDSRIAAADGKSNNCLYPTEDVASLNSHLLVISSRTCLARQLCIASPHRQGSRSELVEIKIACRRDEMMSDESLGCQMTKNMSLVHASELLRVKCQQCNCLIMNEAVTTPTL